MSTDENTETEDTEAHGFGGLNDPTAPKGASDRFEPLPATSEEDDVEGHVYIEPKSEGGITRRDV